MITAQVVSDKVGQARVEEFDIGDLKSVLSNTGVVPKHVTLYPGDYTTWYEDFGSYDEFEPVFIPEDVTVTLMPGAVVDYEEGFRLQDYLVSDGEGGKKFYEGDPISSDTHPLSKPAEDTPEDEYAVRYLRPNFTGNIENITDLNLASEWAFKQEFERSLWSVKGKNENADGDRVQNSIQIPFEGTLQFEGGNKVKIDNEELPTSNEGAKITVRHKTYNDNEDGVVEDNPFLNDGSYRAIQSITVNDGHVLDAETIKVVERLENSDGDLTVSSPRGRISVDHAATGNTDGSGNPIPAPTPPSPDSSADPPIGDSLAIVDFETDNKGHVQNVTYAASVKEVNGGRALTTTYMGSSVYEVSLNATDLNEKDGNLLIEDGGATIDFSLSETVSWPQTSEPSDPPAGESVTWVSDGTGPGSQGDYMIKSNVGGTVKTGTVFDYSAA